MISASFGFKAPKFESGIISGPSSSEIYFSAGITGSNRSATFKSGINSSGIYFSSGNTGSNRSATLKSGINSLENDFLAQVPSRGRSLSFRRLLLQSRRSPLGGRKSGVGLQGPGRLPVRGGFGQGNAGGREGMEAAQGNGNEESLK